MIYTYIASMQLPYLVLQQLRVGSEIHKAHRKPGMSDWMLLHLRHSPLSWTAALEKHPQ